MNQRFTGLKLSGKDRTELRRLETGATRMSPRRWRRVRTLLLLDDGNSIRAAAKAVGGYPREISRVGHRYLKGGLQAALSDDARPKPSKMLDSTQEAAIIAMVCGPPPEGKADWTVRLVAKEAGKRKIVEKVGRETVRKLLAHHDLKPWREKNVVRARDRR